MMIDYIALTFYILPHLIDFNCHKQLKLFSIFYLFYRQYCILSLKYKYDGIAKQKENHSKYGYYRLKNINSNLLASI